MSAASGKSKAVVSAPAGVRPLISKRVAECDAQPALKEVGLRVLSTLVKFVRPTVKPVTRVASLLENMCKEGCVLFKDWSPPSAAPQVPVPLEKATAESVVSDSFKAAYPIAEGSEKPAFGKSWQSASLREETWWQVSIPGDAVPLRTMTLLGLADRLSETVEVLVSPLAATPKPAESDDPEAAAAAAANEWVSLGFVPGASLRSAVTIRLDGVYTRRIRLVFRGFAADSKKKQHSLRHFGCTQARPQAVHTKSAEVLANVEAWLLRAASDSSDSACREAAFGALMKLALCTGAVTAITRVVQVALSSGDTPLSSQFADAGFSFLKSVRDQYFDVCAGASSGSGAGGGLVTRTDVVFSQTAGYHSNGIEFKEGGRVVRCTGGNEVAMLDVPISSGKAAWEFKLEQDSRNGECSCFGFCVRPVNNTNYERSNDMWMYRAYNGNIYQRGRQIKSHSKVHPGDTVRIEIDMDADTASVEYNGQGKVQAWSGFKGLTIYPAVAFYSSNRSIRVLKVELYNASSSDTKVPVATMAPIQEQAKATVNFNAGPNPPPPSGGSTPVAVKLGDKTPKTLMQMPLNSSDGEPFVATVPLSSLAVDTLRATVGLVPVQSDAELMGSAHFSIWADDVELWSAELDSKDATEDVEVQLDVDIEELQFRVRGTGIGSAWRGAWGDATLQSMVWYWDYKKLEAEGSPIVAATQSPPSTFLDLGSRMLLLLKLYANEALRTMRNSKPPAPGSEAMALEVPFTLQVCPAMFQIVLKLLQHLVPVAKGGDATAADVASSVLRLLAANVRRLVVSGIRPREAGLELGVSPSDAGDDESKGGEAEEESKDGQESVLAPLQKMLNDIVALVGNENGALHTLGLEAAEVLDSGMQLFYPSADKRRQRVVSLLESGGVMEVNFSWPTMEEGDDNETRPDPRFERAILLLQTLARRKSWRCASAGHWNGSLHAVVDIPAGGLDAVVKDGLGQVMETAGFQWKFLEGCAHPEILVKVERAVKFDRATRSKTEAGVGWVRLYPSSSADQFDAVCASVDAFVGQHEARAAAVAKRLADLRAKQAAEAAKKANKK